MRRVIIESPCAGDVERNLRYLRACLRDSLLRGEAPFASHAIYAQPGVLDDHDPEQRRLGIEAGFAWWTGLVVIIFYVDLGWSPGMQAALERAKSFGVAWDASGFGARQEFRHIILATVSRRGVVQWHVR